MVTELLHICRPSCSKRSFAAGQQHDGRHPLSQGLPHRREEVHRRNDGPGSHLRHPLPQQWAPGDALQIRGQEVWAGEWNCGVMLQFCCIVTLLSKPNMWKTDKMCCVLQIEKIYKHIMPAWKELFSEKKLWELNLPLEGVFAVTKKLKITSLSSSFNTFHFQCLFVSLFLLYVFFRILPIFLWLCVIVNLSFQFFKTWCTGNDIIMQIFNKIKANTSKWLLVF